MKLNSASAFRAAAALVVVGLFASCAPAAVIYGGATYNSITGTGFVAQGVAYAPGTTAGNSTAVNDGDKYVSGISKGNRAIRWDNSGAPATELGDLGTNSSGFTSNYAYAINTAGTAVGSGYKFVSGIDKGQRAIRWDGSGTAATELGDIGTDASGVTFNRAVAINAAGTSAGFGYKYVAGSFKGERAIRWDSSGTAAMELDVLGTNTSGIAFSNAHAVNSAGTVVGYGDKYVSGSLKGQRAIRWDGSSTTATELGNLGTDPSGFTSNNVAYAVNVDGTAVGRASKYVSGVGKGFRAVRWDGSGTAATELGNLGTNASGVTDILAFAVNTAGTAVGHGDKYVSGVRKGYRAIRWDGTGTAATELGNLGTDASGIAFDIAYAINAGGIAVGFAGEYNLSGTLLEDRAVAWGLDGVAINLNTLLDPSTGWVNLRVAYCISDTGWITGLGTFDPDGAGGQGAYDRAFLMQIPEPTFLALLSCSAGSMLRRRRTT